MIIFPPDVRIPLPGWRECEIDNIVHIVHAKCEDNISYLCWGKGKQGSELVNREGFSALEYIQQ